MDTDRTPSWPANYSPSSKPQTSSKSPDAPSNDGSQPAESRPTGSQAQDRGASTRQSSKAPSPRIKAGVGAALAVGLIAGIGGYGGHALATYQQQQATPAATSDTLTAGIIAAQLGHSDLPAACEAGIAWACGVDSIERSTLSDSTVMVTYADNWQGYANDVAPAVAGAMGGNPDAVARVILADMPADVETVAVMRHQGGHAVRADR